MYFTAAIKHQGLQRLHTSMQLRLYISCAMQRTLEDRYDTYWLQMKLFHTE